ncbi:tRNA (guanine-N1)-methyltransferase [Clostridium sporogenes]|uniref:tRNA (Guanine-N1)-methyltransferase n=1 Tax=Clostridium botulinum TaxID=1491 RepID=A0A6M0T1Y2_CLOBO|nr:tRNA (guanine-N1)-methyltransferase [Clostridium sporogenes]NFA61534.1 tRNA (guanine-N1)-methyltransferase [Clostridium botulinum]NFI74553.1 tRNA (guanine-N1)-methyltransferase [Clostridium sporogenes]NFL71920.1 tRNA (guanine-N1)-methyltransferase [Clostridium sporogenes]NFM24064.1 tRNA (guanine-N1)-methyltransferase [Clostridium sporogenes]NFP62585.1 tRNA (guanine-N1)-methyltransferase [Clostridium sporogenes]
MAKPSIFSKDYERRMKRRKRRTFFSVIVIILISLVVIFTNNGIGKKIKISLNQIKEETKAEEEHKNKQQEQKENKNKNAATVKKESEVSKDNNIEVQLEDNIKIKLIYIEDSNKNKTIKSIDLNKNNLLYDINPSKNLIVVTNPKTQNIYLVNLNGEKQDITNKQYTSTSGTTFQKDAILASKQDYFWGVLPKFIDNDNIAYVSQLPWFNKTTKYVWMYNIKNKTHLYNQNISGEDIKFDKLTEKGLTVVSDSKTLFLKADGSVAE